VVRLDAGHVRGGGSGQIAYDRFRRAIGVRDGVRKVGFDTIVALRGRQGGRRGGLRNDGLFGEHRGDVGVQGVAVGDKIVVLKGSIERKK
jgi:hypothetical protein